MSDFAWWCDPCTEAQGRPVASEDCDGHAACICGESLPLLGPGVTEGHWCDELDAAVQRVDDEFKDKLKSMQFLLPGPFRAVKGKTD